MTQNHDFVSRAFLLSWRDPPWGEYPRDAKPRFCVTGVPPWGGYPCDARKNIVSQTLGNDLQKAIWRHGGTPLGGYPRDAKPRFCVTGRSRLGGGQPRDAKPLFCGTGKSVLGGGYPRYAKPRFCVTGEFVLGGVSPLRKTTVLRQEEILWGTQPLWH